MDRRNMLKVTGMAVIGMPALRSLSVAANKKDHTMSFERKSIEGLAAAYTSAWNTGSAESVAAYFAENGEIVINRGAPWRGRAGVGRGDGGRIFRRCFRYEAHLDLHRARSQVGTCPHRTRLGRVGRWRRSQG